MAFKIKRTSNVAVHISTQIQLKVTAYDQALQKNAENIINATPNVELNKATIEQALTHVQQAQQDLDGVQQLANSKHQATQNVDGLSSLNDGQKRELNLLNQFS